MVQQLTQGVTPRKLAVALAVGFVVAINPFLGTATLGCLLAGIALRLNQPALQIANLLATPVQLLLVVPWVRAGEWLWGAPPMPLEPTQIVAEFAAGPLEFLARFGRTGVHAASAWIFAAPLMTALVYFTTLPLLRRGSGAGRRADPTPNPAATRAPS